MFKHIKKEAFQTLKFTRGHEYIEINRTYATQKSYCCHLYLKVQHLKLCKQEISERLKRTALEEKKNQTNHLITNAITKRIYQE